METGHLLRHCIYHATVTVSTSSWFLPLGGVVVNEDEKLNWPTQQQRDKRALVLKAKSGHVTDWAAANQSHDLSTALTTGGTVGGLHTDITVSANDNNSDVSRTSIHTG